MASRKYSEEQFIKAVETSTSIAEVCRKLGLKEAGGNYSTINKKITELGLDKSHFKGHAWNKGLELGPNYFGTAKSLDEILVEDSDYQSSKLVKRLIRAGIKEYKCECCGNTEWLGNPIPLELHHVNGIHSDNRLENLQVICPNCHALTDNYRGKNIGN